MSHRPHLLLALAAVLALLGAAHAEGDEKKGDGKKTMLQRVMEALASEDKDALKTLVHKDHVDAWMLVDDLLGLKEPHAATRYAAHAAEFQADYAKLPRYVANYVGQESETQNRSVFRRVVAATKKRDLAAIEACVLDANRKRDEVMTVRIEHVYALALFSAGRGRKSGKQFELAAERAERIGWLRLAADSYKRGAEAMGKAGDYAGAVKLAEKRLDMESGRKKSLNIAAALKDLARAQLRAGQFEEAAENARMAAARFGFHENKAELAGNLSLAGVALRRDGKLKDALTAGTKALEIANRLDDDHLKGVASFNLAATHEALKQRVKAIKLYEQAARLLHSDKALAAQARERQAKLQKEDPPK